MSFIFFVIVHLTLLLLSVGPALGSNTQLHYLNQGFDEETRQTFYHASQGTRLVPYSWFLALEQATNTIRFLDDEHLHTLGIIPDHHTLKNPDQLPVGFAKTLDPIGKEAWVGLTCSACHTAEVVFREHRIRIDGGPAMVDAMALAKELENALTALVGEEADKDKFSRFAKIVLKGMQTRSSEQQLFEQVKAFLRLLQRPQHIAQQLHIDLYPNQWGRGRLDALGRGGNTVLLPLDISNIRSADAPVSFPAIWRTWDLNWVQWNGSVRQPLGRNLLQALGLNATVTVDPSHQSFRPSSSIKNLVDIEKIVRLLQPPAWPDHIFGTPIDQIRASRGAQLYERHCAHCHVPKLTEPNEYGWQFKNVFLIPLGEIGTDPVSATNFHYRTVKSGPLGLGVLTASDTAQYLTTHILNQQYQELGISEEEQKRLNGGRSNTMRAPLAYVARPHSGVWALAPYLHNGSIPNLYQLLSPIEERDEVFYVGHGEFDPLHVGFVTEKLRPSDFKFDTTLPGNSNAGHEFRDGLHQNGVIGPALSIDDRWDLIEYLKTL